MAVFGGMTITTKGIALQGKAQAGAALNYTRIAVGDGTLSGQSISALNGLISQKKNLPITRLKTQLPNKAVIGAVLSNAEITTGFYFREVGVFAHDPDVGEILYAYANSGVTADYIAPADSTDIIEKSFDCIVVVGTAANITAVIDESLVYALRSDLDAVAAIKVDKVGGKQLSTEDYTTAEKAKLAGITAGAGGTGSASDTVIGNRTISDSTAPTGETGTLTTLLGWLANMIKGITGKSSWRTAPATTLEAAKVHADDATRHITAPERTTWNAKETPGGAQSKADAAKDAAINAAAQDATSKADAAESAAKNASIPTTQKGAANGVAALNEIGQVMGSGLSLGGNKLGESIFTFSFAHGVQNQKLNLVHTGLTAGFVEVTVAGTWVNGNAAGKLTKRYEIITDGGGTISYQTDAYTEVTGPIQDAISISPISWDSSASTLIITIEAQTSNGNDYVVSIKQMSPHGYVAWSKGTVYTGAATTLPRAVQTIPDDTVTRSGYLIQKHRLTTPTGTVINLSTGYNLNNLTVNGFFDGESFVNAPNNITDWFYIESYVHSNNQWDYRFQRATTLNGSPTRKPSTFERIQVGGVWGAWSEVAAGDSVFKINGLVDKDYNQIVKPGTYQIYGGIFPNAPALTAPWGILNVYLGSNSYVVQEVTQTTAPYGKWYRAATETAWSPWRKVITDADTPVFAKAGLFVTFGGAMTGVTTAEFITMLNNMGAHSPEGGYWVGRGDWSYGTNAYITDSGFGKIHLAGAVVEVIGSLVNDKYTIRVTTPPTNGVDADTTNSEFTYVNNGIGYYPAWRRSLNTANTSGLFGVGNTVSNANTLVYNGSYVVTAAWTGSPWAGTDGSNQGYLTHTSWNADNSYAMQTFMPINATDVNRTGMWYRRKLAGVWGTWTRTYSAENDVGLFKERGGIPAGSDLNDYHGNGSYMLLSDWYATYVHRPPVDSYYVLTVSRAQSSGGFVKQTATQVFGSFEYYRTRTDQGFWSPWVEVMTSESGNSFVKRGAPSAGEDLNNKTALGMYTLAANASYINGPGLDWCVLNVYMNSNGYIVQEATNVGSDTPRKRFRTRTEANYWSRWTDVVTTDSTGRIPGVAANRVAINGVPLTTTASTTVATYTVPTTGMYTVKICLHAANQRDVAINVNYAGMGGSKSRVVLPYLTTMPPDDWDFIPVTILCNAGSNINVVAQTTIASSVYITATITQEG
ncbi:phage tail protein [Paenibacillus sp. sgz500992]|uniref:phage tail-collar fiber domain-containing protein n=1 Tax=Paenibacillus sp. sgz500992 TaxID=3242476 RepID=UPI0036D23C2A